jgi:hypothetical protein
VREAQIFTKLYFWNANHLIRIKEGEKFKTTLRTLYGQFQNRVLPFWLRNERSTFQAYVDDWLGPCIEDFTVCYLDDILIYSTNKKEREDHIRKVLQCLQEFRLSCKAKKCQFGVRKVSIQVSVLNSD